MKLQHNYRKLWWGNRHCWKETTKFRTSVALKQHFCVAGSQDSHRKGCLFRGCWSTWYRRSGRNHRENHLEGQSSSSEQFCPSEDNRHLEESSKRSEGAPRSQDTGWESYSTNFIHSWIQIRPSWRQHLLSDWWSQKSKQTGEHKKREHTEI